MTAERKDLWSLLEVELSPEDKLWREGKRTRLCSCRLLFDIESYGQHLKNGEHNRRIREMPA
jgi:hypothetical protein